MLRLSLTLGGPNGTVIDTPNPATSCQGHPERLHHLFFEPAELNVGDLRRWLWRWESYVIPTIHTSGI